MQMVTSWPRRAPERGVSQPAAHPRFHLACEIFDLGFALCPFWWQKPPFWQIREFQMNWGIRGFVLAAGAAALISTQAVYAAPQAHRAVGVDPLVSLSVLGTTQSRASLVAAAAVVQDAPPAVQTCPDGSVIPVTATCSPPPGPPPGHGIGALPLVLGLVVFLGLVALIASGNGDSHGDLTPVSPD
jgi:hypothetical protein